MMKKLFFNLCSVLLLTSSVFFASCSDDDDPAEQKVNVRFEAAPYIEGALNKDALEGLKVVFTEVRNQEKTEAILDNTGAATVELFKSTYDIAIEETAKNEQGDDVVISLRIENFSVNAEGQVIEGKVNSLPKSALGKNFIFSEIFFNGERNSGKMMHPDQYFVIFNPTNEVLYADGLSVAVTHHLSWQDKAMWYDKFYPTKVPVGGFVTIPGSGKEHAVAPGEKLVVAFTAIDHSKTEGYDHAVDLSGADYEVFYGADVKGEVDNPAVPNVLLTENSYAYGFMFQPRGYVSPLMFKLENGKPETIEAFVKANTKRTDHFVPADEEKGTPEQVIQIDILSVDTDKIIDGVQTSDVPQDVKTRVIPEVVDRGKFLVEGCHRQQLAIRKEIKVGNKTFYKDTNNSIDDFVPVQELKEKGQTQTAFPEGWRNK